MVCAVGLEWVSPRARSDARCAHACGRVLVRASPRRASGSLTLLVGGAVCPRMYCVRAPRCGCGRARLIQVISLIIQEGLHSFHDVALAPRCTRAISCTESRTALHRPTRR